MPVEPPLDRPEEIEGLPWEKEKKLLRRFRLDPPFWCREALGDKGEGRELDEFQNGILRAVAIHDRVDVKSGNEVGKTYAFARIALWFLANFPPASVICTSSTDRQLEGQFWKEVSVAYARGGGARGFGGRMVTGKKLLDMGGPDFKWFMLAFSTDDEAYFEGWHNVNILLLFDESKGIADTIWRGGERLLRGVGGIKKWVVGGTPPLAPLGEFCRISLDAAKARLWYHINFSAWDSGRVSKQVCENSLKTLGKNNPFYISMVEGRIPEGSEDNLINILDIEEASKREEVVDGEVEYGVDVARKGSCETVIVRRKGGRCWMWPYPGGVDNRTTHTVLRLKEKLDEFDGGHQKEIPLKIDDTGVGGGVTDMLLAEDYNAIECNFGGATNDPDHYYDYGTEMLANLGALFRAGQIIIPNDAALKSQLWERSKKIPARKGGRILFKLMSKEDLMKDPSFEESHSPDRADALALAFAPYPPINTRDVKAIPAACAGIRSVPNR